MLSRLLLPLPSRAARALFAAERARVEDENFKARVLALAQTAAGQYAIELGLLAPARSSSARGDYNAALRSIARHQREFPSGQLAEEREALRIRALWGLGQRPEAEAAAAAFRARYPRSGLLSWMTGLPTR